MKSWLAILFVPAVLTIALAGCRPDDPDYSVDDLPPGDAARGETLFSQSIDGAPACANCHAVDGSGGSGPSLDGFGAVAAERNDGQSAQEYAFTSIMRPAKYLVRGYSNVMYSDYADKLNQQDTADLIAYMLAQ
jgi:cytochrome c553